MSKNVFVKQNSKYPRCVDGRKAFVFLEKKGGDWQVVLKGSEAEQENGPQFLGASLLFVAAAQEILNYSLVQAFDLAEKASNQVGVGLQIHLDDHHGKYDFVKMSDEDLVALMSEYHGGCGFSVYYWKEKATQVIAEAKKRGWRVQLLTGDHAEGGAIENYVKGQTFDTATAVNQERARFNTDIDDAKRVFHVMGVIANDANFAQAALAWMLSTYKDVVVALKGVSNVDEVVINK